MLLFLVFVLCALFTVLIGGKVYENINSRIEENYSGQVVLNYVANKVRQGDEAGRVAVKTMEDTPVLELTQEINGRKFVTWIYYRDGAVRELFTNEGSGLGLKDGLEIMECRGLTFVQEDSLLKIQVTGAETNSLLLNIRSGGGQDEE
ncbi:MAG: DUF4860 domain-containing protein [Hungatella sp.]|jgi:hypothetical protein|nr:DUF4860 domain-containing protein [Hungatella sp.]